MSNLAVGDRVGIKHGCAEKHWPNDRFGLGVGVVLKITKSIHEDGLCWVEVDWDGGETNQYYSHHLEPEITTLENE